MDEEMRKTERAAAGGDEDAAKALAAAGKRVGVRPYASEGAVYVPDDEALNKAIQSGRRATMRICRGDLVLMETDRYPAHGKWLGYVTELWDSDDEDEEREVREKRGAPICHVALVDALGSDVDGDYEAGDSIILRKQDDVIVVRRRGVAP